MNLKKLSIFFLLILSFRESNGATGCYPDGKLRFDQSSKTLQICSSFWTALDVAAVRSACALADKGKQRFSSGELQYCDGVNWNSLNNCPATTSSCSPAGRVLYDEMQAQLLYCDGTYWVAAFGACGTSVGCSVHKDATSCSDDPNCLWSSGSCSDNGSNTNPGGPGSPI